MILMYHKIATETPTEWWVSSENFQRQMSELADKEIKYLNDYDPQNPSHVAITFDDAYQNIHKHALTTLNEFGYPFEVFVISDYLGKPNDFRNSEPECQVASISELKDLVKGGGRLQWHTRSHPNLSLFIEKSKLERELEIPEELKILNPEGFDWFAYPYGEFNEAALALVRKKFKGAVTIDQGANDDPHTVHRIMVTNTSSF